MVSGAAGTLQARIAELRTRVQQQTASIRSRFGRGGKQISFKDGNPLGPLGIGGAGGLEALGSGPIMSKVSELRKRVLPGSGLEGMETLPIVTKIRTQGVVGALRSGVMTQTLTGGGYRPELGVSTPSTKTPPRLGPEGYRKFV